MAPKNVKNQRPRYFAGQYLLEEDFELEQDYHIERQCRHNRLLHVSGILEGLIVTKDGDSKVKVSPGTAVDQHGQQIVLLDEKLLDLPDKGGKTLFIQYNQHEDKTSLQEDTSEGYRRILEEPIIGFDSSDSASAIKLAILTVESGKININTSVREYSGLRLPSSAKEGLTLRYGGDNASNLAVLSGGLSVQGSLNVTGNVGIGTGSTVPIKKLQIESGELRVKASHNNETADIGTFYANNLNQGIGIGCNRIEAIGNNLNQDILIHPKGSGKVGIGTTTNLAAKLQVQIDGETTDASLKLEHNNSNFIVRPLSAGGNSSVIENTGRGNLIINPTNGDVGGNVGIGIIAPVAKLEVKGSTSTNSTAALHVTNAETKSLLYVRNDGCVGIGTTNPLAKLEISGGNLNVSGNVGIGTTTAPSKKLQIESGELSVKASNNNEATDIGAFWANDQSQGIGIRCNSIQAVGNNPDQNINLVPKGQGIVQVIGSLSVTSVTSLDSLSLNINNSFTALKFDGIDDYVQILSGSWFNDEGFTVEAWVYVREIKNTSCLLDFGNGNSDNVLISLCDGNSGKVSVQIYNGTTPEYPIITDDQLPLNQWVHIACVVLRNLEIRAPGYSTVTIYKNGQVWKSGSTKMPQKVTRSTNYIGRNWRTNAYSAFSVSEFRIWKTPRTSQQIQESIYKRLVGNEDGLAGYWRFDESGYPFPLTAKDYSPGKRDGIILSGAAPDKSNCPLNFIDFRSGSPSSSNPSLMRIQGNGNVGIGTTSLGAKLSISASANHLQLRREYTETTGDKILFLELYQDDPDITVPEVWPSIRFHHYRRYFHRIEARSNGLHFKEGNLNNDGYIDIYARNVASCVETLQMIRGTVQSNGLGLDIGFKGFTVTKKGTGLYLITFDKAFLYRPTVVVTQEYPSNFDDNSGDTRDNAVVVAVDTTKFQIKCGDRNGVAADRQFHFIAIGPR